MQRARAVTLIGARYFEFVQFEKEVYSILQIHTSSALRP